MRDVDAISVVGIAYALIVTAITAIFFRTYIIWPVLGAATALFNHSIMIRITKNGFSPMKYMVNIVFRFLMYGIICAYVYFNTVGESMTVVITTYVFLFLGFSTIRAGIFLSFLPFIKHHTTSYKEEVEARQKRLAEEANEAHVDDDR